MALHFQSLRSSSSGNCLMLRTGTTTILLDCGIKTYGECRSLLGQHARKLDGVVVSHAHSDHICYYSLRALEERGTPVHCHHQVIPQICQKHTREGNPAPQWRSFSDQPFEIGDLTIQPVQVPHAPGYLTFGFVIWHGKGEAQRKLAFCTDFNDYRSIVGHLTDADFVFIEANHDLELLRRFWNPSSRFHLSNPHTGKLLSEAGRNGHFAPQVVMLGHLSNQRNSDELALASVREKFQAEGIDVDFRLEVAPRYAASREIAIE